jgi:hypothetical protein
MDTNTRAAIAFDREVRQSRKRFRLAMAKADQEMTPRAQARAQRRQNAARKAMMQAERWSGDYA